MDTMDMPPTTHALRQTQRTRLMRSTRKLEALLGETPRLVEPPRGHAHTSSTSSIESKRSGRIFATTGPAAPPRSSSLTAVEAPSASHEPAARPLLLLRLPSTPGSRPISALPSPLSPAFGPNTPPSDPSADRRRKMAKLTRTLGQNVPPELVFQAQPQSHSPYRRPRRASADAVAVSAILAGLGPQPHTPRSSRGSSASLSPPRSPVFYASRTPSPAPSSSRAPSPAYYATAFSSSAERVGSRAPSPAFPHDDYPFPTRVTYDEREDEWVRVPSLPHSPTSTAAHPSTTTRSTRSERFLSRTFEFAEAPSGNWNNGGGRGGVGPGTSTTYRRESRQGWSGEWGGAAQGLGMNEVVNRLRGLKMK
ncbi:hypothetical protein C8J57DRAFT_1393069 [Mycena rebaudengoi]|nr:hypothetical protein C8J57DRAFT_1393069 [Mycena rebaudengoi]